MSLRSWCEGLFTNRRDIDFEEEEEDTVDLADVYSDSPPSKKRATSQ